MGDNPWGRTWYHGLQVRYEKRMMGDASRSGALTWVFSYTWSKTMENALRQNQTFEWMALITIDRRETAGAAEEQRRKELRQVRGRWLWDPRFSARRRHFPPPVDTR